MAQTYLKVRLDTHLPLTEEQRRRAKQAVAMALKELEYGHDPRGNTIQRAFIMELDEE